MFFNILDLAGINASVLLKEVTGSAITRRDFHLQLATELSDQYATARGRQHTNDDDDEDEDYSWNHCCSVASVGLHTAREI